MSFNGQRDMSVQTISEDEVAAQKLQDTKIDVKLKLATLWTSTMFCYVYGDYFGLYTQGKLQSMIDGKMGPLGQATDMVLLGVSLMMAIPAVMIFLSIILPPVLNRVLNIIFGLIYSAIMVLTMMGGAPYYLFFGTIEVILTLLIIFFGWTWPKTTTDES